MLTIEYQGDHTLQIVSQATRVTNRATDPRVLHMIIAVPFPRTIWFGLSAAMDGRTLINYYGSDRLNLGIRSPLCLNALFLPGLFQTRSN
jgi:hypothetical protein